MPRGASHGFAASRIVMLALAAAMAAAQFVGVSHLQAAQPLSLGEVAIVTDNTFNDVCSFETTDTDGTVTARACAPGTVIKVERVAADLAASRGVAGGFVVNLTGALDVDEALIEETIAAVRSEIALQGGFTKSVGPDDASARQICPYRDNYFISGTYGVGGGQQVNYSLIYDVNSNCTINQNR